MNKRNISSRLKEIAENEGTTITSLETMIGASKGTLTRAIKNQTDINSKWVVKVVEKYPKYSPIWILTGSGKMITDNEQVSNLIPVYPSIAQAGIGAMFQEFSHSNPIDYIRIPKIHTADAAIYAFGDSMLPLINPGDLIVYKQIYDVNNSIIPGKKHIVSFELESDIITVVKYVNKGSNEDTLLLVSENDFYQPMEVKKSKIMSIARVLCVVQY